MKHKIPFGVFTGIFLATVLCFAPYSHGEEPKLFGNVQKVVHGHKMTVHLTANVNL